MTDQTTPSPSSKVCPKCQRLNCCQRGSLLSSQTSSQVDSQTKSQNDFQCWCKTVDLSSTDLAAVTREYGSASCLCESCLKEIADNSLKS